MAKNKGKGKVMRSAKPDPSIDKMLRNISELPNVGYFAQGNFQKTNKDKWKGPGFYFQPGNGHFYVPLLMVGSQQGVACPVNVYPRINGYSGDEAYQAAKDDLIQFRLDGYGRGVVTQDQVVIAQQKGLEFHPLVRYAEVLGIRPRTEKYHGPGFYNVKPIVRNKCLEVLVVGVQEPRKGKQPVSGMAMKVYPEESKYKDVMWMLKNNRLS